MNKQLKLFHSNKCSLLEEAVNDFIKDKSVLDIKYTIENKIFYCAVIYEEKRMLDDYVQDRYNKAFNNACSYIVSLKEPLCTLDKCECWNKPCRDCEHSISTFDEWKGYFLYDD